MAAEEEILSVTMDNGQAKQALSELNTALEKTGKSAKDAANDLNKLGAASDSAGDATEKKVVRLKEADRTYESMLRRIPGTTEALQKYSQVQQRAAIDLANGRIQQETYNRVIEEASNKYVRAAQATVQATTAQRAAMQATASSASSLKGNLANLGYQLQDVAVQAQMGTSWFTIIAQQGPQAASGFGAVGVAIGTVIALASVAAGVFFGMGDKLSDAEKAAKAYEGTMSSVRDIIDVTAAAGKKLRDGQEEEAISVADLTAKYRTLSETMLQVERIRIAAAKNKVNEDIAAQRTSVGELLGELKDYEAFVNRINELKDFRGDKTPAPAGYLDAFNAIKAFRESAPTDIEAIGRLSVALDKVAQSGGPFAEQAKKAAASLVDPAKRSVELSEQLTRLEDGLTAVSAAGMKLVVPGRKPGETTGGALEETGKQARTLADILGDLANGENVTNAKDVGKAWDAVNDVMKEAETPAERYRKKVTQVQEAIDLLQKHAESLGDGLKAFSPAQIDAINEALRKQDPAFEDARKSAEKYQQDVARVATDIGKDISSNLWDQITGQAKAGDALQFFKNWAKRLAVEMLNQNLVLPITMQIVGAVPSLFGIQAPANQNGTASAGGSLTNSATNWLGGKAVSYGADKLGLSGIGTSIAGSIDSFGASALGIGVVPEAGAHGMLVGGGATSSAAAPAGAAYGLSSYLGAGLAGVGVGSLVGGGLGTLTNSKTVGGLSGAASGALAGFLVGGPWGALIGGIGGGLGGQCGDRPTEGRTVAANVNIQMENAA